MEFSIRPVEIGDAKGINALRRMPGVFENILGIPSERVKRSENFIANLDSNHHQLVAVTKLENGEELIIGTAVLMQAPVHAIVEVSELWFIRIIRIWVLVPL